MGNELATLKEGGPLTAIDLRKQVNLIQEVMKSVMIGPTKENPEGVHYGVVPGTKKPSLLKPGAEKIAMTFRLGAEYEELPGSVEGDSFICYKINCKLFYIPTGNIVGHGRGACNSKEKKYLTRFVYANKATDEEKATGKLETRQGNSGAYDVYIVPQNPWDVQNTIMKMACKRAQVAAVLNATAASDIFTQDVEEIPEGTIIDGEAHAAPQSTKPPTSAPQSTQKPPASTANGARLISDNQAKRFYAIAMGRGIDADRQKEWLDSNYGIDDSRKIPSDKYEEIVKAVQELE
jgi:hypothetical protein